MSGISTEEALQRSDGERPDTYEARMAEVLGDASLEWRGEVRPGTDEAILREIWDEQVYRAKPHLADGGTVVDVGAHAGFFCVWALQHGAERVVAVEPREDEAAQLRRNIAKHGMTDRVSVVEAAIGPTVVWEGESEEAAAQTTLDELVRMAGDNIAVLKIDCESCEYALFRNVSDEALAACRFITVEFHSSILGDVGAIVQRLGETHDVTMIGRPSVGGYIYAERYHGEYDDRQAVPA